MHERQDLIVLAWPVCPHKAARSRSETHLAVRHSSAVIAAEEVQAGVRAQDVPIDLLHHLRILRRRSPAFSDRQAGRVRGAGGGQNAVVEGMFAIT